jgi:omega-6 fatty acid desaturase (delta-12 desaturase)
VRDTAKGLRYTVRDFILAAAFWYLATYIDPLGRNPSVVNALTPLGAEVFRWSLWGVYWWYQGLNFVRLFGCR